MADSGKELTQRERDRIAKLRAAGLSIRQIAYEERLSPTTVQKNLKKSLAE